jgi:hypothetical protein
MSMYKYVRRVLGIAESVGEVTDIFMGNYGEKQEAIWLNGFTPEGKGFHMELRINKEGTEDGD